MSYAPTERGASPTTMRRALEESFELIMIQQIRRDAGARARFRHPAVDVQLLTPRCRSCSGRSTRPRRDRRLLALGRADALACLEAWERK